MPAIRKERYSSEAYRRFQRSVFRAVRFGILWLGSLAALIAWMTQQIWAGEELVPFAALITGLFLFSLVTSAQRLHSLFTAPHNLMPYFKGTVPGCGLTTGHQLLDHSRVLDSLARSAGVRPVSHYISDDDLFDKRPPTWHSPLDALATFEVLLRDFADHPAVQAAHSDLAHVRDRLQLAQAGSISFCLLYRDIHVTCGMEWEQRQGSC